MFVKKNFSLKEILTFGGHHFIWLTAWATAVTAFFEYFHWEWLSIPWLPLSVMGIAVAFYIGFKNNSAYDRLWEARKIWGSIVNSSRFWGATVSSYVGNQFRSENINDQELHDVHQDLIYRHIAWLYALRIQLLQPTPWEHISQGGQIQKFTEKRMKEWGVGLHAKNTTEKNIKALLKQDEIDKIRKMKNPATQLIFGQSKKLAKLREENLIDDFRHMELQGVLDKLYTFQGQAERIKKFPLPRQYGSMSFVFVCIFLFFLPLGMVSEFHSLGEWGPWASIPFTVITGWLFVMMELIGDYSENPFEGMGNDIPMLALTRTIELDLREMLGETDLPEPIQAINGVLM